MIKHWLVATAAVLVLVGCSKGKSKDGGKADGTGTAAKPPKDKQPPGKFRYPVGVGDKMGYIDEHGTMVIEPQFAFAHRFSEGLAQVQVGELWGYVDEAGKLVIPATFKKDEGVAAMPENLEANAFHGGAAIVIDATGKRVVIDKTGKTTWMVEGDLQDVFGEGLAPVRKDGKTVFVDPTGKIVLDKEYEEARGFHEGLAAVRSTGIWTYTDPTGAQLSLSLGTALDFSDGRAMVQQSGETYFIDKTGAKVIPGPFSAESTKPFSSGVTWAVMTDGSYEGWIDVNGKQLPELKAYVADTAYGSDDYFVDGMMAVDDTETVQYVDTTGKVIDTKLPNSDSTRVGPFQNGLAQVTVVADKITNYFVDKTGKQVYP